MIASSSPILVVLGPGSFGELAESERLASMRLRVLPLERAAHQLGWWVWRPETLDQTWNALQQPGLSVVYLGKWSPPPTAEATTSVTQLFETFLNRIQPQLNAKLLFDCCENNFVAAHAWHRDYASFWAAQADVCIASTNALASEVLPRQVGPSCSLITIADCTEQIAVPSACSANGPGIGWFGHDTNIQPLLDLAFAHRPVSQQLTLITRAEVLRDRLGSQNLLKRFEDCFQAVHWYEYESPQQLSDQLQGVGSVVLPVNGDDARKRYSSHNRLTTALLLGKKVFASPIPAYEPFSDLAVLASDPLAACLQGEQPQCCLAPQPLRDRLNADFGVERIEQQYRQLLSDVAPTSPKPR
ncbi:hypothetical protein [Synechococcus sp. Minos11]|uniref:hypothetical protein n=1 Tax=Synechococcus sp. Minos11 TaxID=221341 RepID=UPI001646EF5F|nr:hypothetical protein [Synechococcus sp. Minos11]